MILLRSLQVLIFTYIHMYIFGSTTYLIWHECFHVLWLLQFNQLVIVITICFQINLSCLQIQSTDGAGASPHTSLTEEGKKLDDLYQQVATKDDKIADLEKQLYLMTMESNSLQETKKQLEQMKQRGERSVQQRTVTPDHMALIAQMEEYDKAKQDLEAEKNAMKNVREKNSELQREVHRLKQQLLRIETDSQSGTTVLASPVNVSETATSQLDDSSVEDPRRLLKEREEEAKALVDSINQKEKTLTDTIAKYEDLLKSTKSVSIALKERNEHIQKQSKRIAELIKEAEVSNYFCSWM